MSTPNVEAALHLCVLLAAIPGRALSARDLAEFHDLSRGATAKLLQQLATAGVLSTRAGRRGGYVLAQPADQIRVADVAGAARGSAPEFRCQEIRQQGPCAADPSAYSARCAIARLMDDAERAWWAVLADQTLASLSGRLARQVDSAIQERSSRWLHDRSRDT